MTWLTRLTRGLGETPSLALACRPAGIVSLQSTNLQSIERTPYGVLLRLPDTVENAADLRQFANEEKDCCAFWGFEVIEQPRPHAALGRPARAHRVHGSAGRLLRGRAPIGSVFAGRY